MPSKYELMSQVAAEKALEIASDADQYMTFLETAAANYKYTFKSESDALFLTGFELASYKSSEASSSFHG